jgi:hypothetical protein
MNLGHLIRQNIRRGRRGFVLSVFGISVGVASLAFFLALSSGMRHGVLSRLFPQGQLEVVPPSSSLDSGALSIFSLGGSPKLGDEIAAQLAKRPEVAAVYPRMRLSFPARAQGGAAILGRDIRAEMVAEGMDPAAMSGESFAPIPFSDELGSQTPCTDHSQCTAPEYCAIPLGTPQPAPEKTGILAIPPGSRALPPGAGTLSTDPSGVGARPAPPTAATGGSATGPVWQGRCERPVPAVISPFILELYNGAIAPQHGLPRVGRFLAGRFRGFTFTAELGASFFGMRGQIHAPPVQRRIMLVGIAPRAAQLALTLPLGHVRAWNAAYTGPQAAKELSSVVLVLREGADVARLSAAIRSMGFTLADSGAEKIGLLLTLLTLLFALVSLAIVTVAAVNIAHGFFRQVAERKRELGVMRAVGASGSDIMRLVLGEAAVIGLNGGLVGLAVARAGAFALDLASTRFLPDFPFKPESYFSFGWMIVAGAILCSVLACVAGAWLPARAAAKLDPTEALSTP